MEVALKSSVREKLKNFALKDKVYFLKRREINWGSLRKCGALALLIGIVGILLIPAPEEYEGEFHEKSLTGDKTQTPRSIPVSDLAGQFGGTGYANSTPSSLDHLYRSSSVVSGSSSIADKHSSSMILSRDGLDGKTQLPPGSRISVRLFEKVVVSGQGMPVIGITTRDYIHENQVAIPQGSKLFGDISFDSDQESSKINWKSIQLPDGRERPMSAVGVGADGQLGVPGRVHSKAMRNTLGVALTRFIGAYAEGSMQRGALGGSPGGNDNGWKNAIAETAKGRAEGLAEDLKKEKQWIEISNTREFYAVLTANFAFRDPGSTYGR